MSAHMLTESDWGEIFYALESKIQSSVVLGDREWIGHLRSILQKIGPDGETAFAWMNTLLAAVEFVIGDIDEGISNTSEWRRILSSALAPKEQELLSEPTPYTVVLLWPDYLGDYGRQTSVHHVWAMSQAEAARQAQLQRFALHTVGDPGASGGPDDFHPLAAFYGHVSDLLVKE